MYLICIIIRNNVRFNNLSVLFIIYINNHYRIFKIKTMFGFWIIIIQKHIPIVMNSEILKS